MQKEFKKILGILSELNKFKNNDIYSEANLQEEKDNIEDIDKLEKNLKILIETLEKTDKNDKDKVIKSLIDLHIVFCDFIGQYDRLHEMIKDTIGKYR
ncbi:hypothetical protein BH721_03425 [Clostridium baratii]|uniref:hypothetical protein n=1 Tax=Clostridium baratii TaxID=1561 RepID=UPI0009A3BDCF|nr:hypothetical protein [Clostridium baratii]OPF51155.1 hypothetical protein A1M12_01050 [Clostridium baratii]OPF55768.1 hypothetical protein BH721_03425 [Clostridium baratii]OPF56852.1 hypothetical protein BH724_10000 [Clostridium baratii]OPF59851.1 hypothetical protein BH725_04500 [Clostridium baratii]